MEIKDMMMDQVEARLAEIRSEIDSADAARILELDSEVDELNARKAEILNEAEKRSALLNKVAADDAAKIVEKKPEEASEERKDMTNMEIRNTKEYIDAFASYCKTGSDAECRALLTETVDGSVPVPAFVAGIVAERFKESKILSRVRKMNAAGNVKIGFEISAPAAGTHEEGGDPMPEEELSLGIVTLVATTKKKWVSISDEALDSMSGEAYLRYVYDEIARGIVKARENAVIYAILHAPQTATETAPAVAKTGTAAGAITDFVNARALLSSAAQDLVIICTPAQYASYRGLQMAAQYGVDPFDGLEVLFNDTVTAPIIGDLGGVLENLPRGENPVIKYDDKTRMKDDLVDILGRLPVATAVVGNLYFAKVSA